MIQIRKAKTMDISSIKKLLYEVHQVHYNVRPDLFKAGCRKYNDDEVLAFIHSKDTPIFVAVLEDEVVGYAFCIPKQLYNHPSMVDIRTLYIDDFCIEESVRGKQIGKRLYEYVLQYAKNQGFYNVTLNVWADNADAVNFYKKIGMQIQKIGMEVIL